MFIWCFINYCHSATFVFPSSKVIYMHDICDVIARAFFFFNTWNCPERTRKKIFTLREQCVQHVKFVEFVIKGNIEYYLFIFILCNPFFLSWMTLWKRLSAFYTNNRLLDVCYHLAQRCDFFFLWKKIPNIIKGQGKIKKGIFRKFLLFKLECTLKNVFITLFDRCANKY